MFVSLAGVLWSVNVDWEANVFLAVVLAGLLGAAFFVPRRWFGTVDARAVVQWCALAAAIAAVTLGLYALYFHRIRAIEALLASEVKRSRGNDLPLSAVLQVRRYWIDVSFTPLAILVGKIAVPIFFLRWLVLRRALEVFPIAIWAMAVVQYVKFKNGADVHIYWPLPFAPYFALSVAVIAASGCGIARWVLERLRREDRRGLAPRIALATAGLIPLAILPDGIAGLHYARMTGGRFNEKGHRIYREMDKTIALEWMSGQMITEPTVVELHEGMKSTWSQQWALHRPVRTVSSAPLYHSAGGEERYFIGDMTSMLGADVVRLAQAFPVVAVGPYLFADREKPQVPAEAYTFEEREPNLLEWYLVSGVDPVRKIRPDPWYRWELREHWGQTPNPAPPGPPSTLEEVRIAHNMAVAEGDTALAERYQQQLVDQLNTRVAVNFTDGTRLLGQRYAAGVAPTLTLYFLASGAADLEYQFLMESVLEDKQRLSLVPMDEKVQELGRTFAMSPKLWKKGFIYADRNEIRHRPGREQFFGFFDIHEGHAPKPLGGGDEVALIKLY